MTLCPATIGEEWGAHGGVWECPDLFPLTDPVTGETRWILILNLNPGGPQGGSGTQYFVGDFDGTRFTLDPEFARTLEEQEAVWLDWGPDNYAGITWSGVPEGSGIPCSSSTTAGPRPPTGRSASRRSGNCWIRPSGKAVRCMSCPLRPGRRPNRFRSAI